MRLWQGVYTTTTSATNGRGRAVQTPARSAQVVPASSSAPSPRSTSTPAPPPPSEGSSTARDSVTATPDTPDPSKPEPVFLLFLNATENAEWADLQVRATGLARHLESALGGYGEKLNLKSEAPLVPHVPPSASTASVSAAVPERRGRISRPRRG
ncbi:hypothetical protein SISNIDRAFT_67541 [Sistotremastrum niveocremeum HHB9708]|uniref:Uncharacterized protein n=1 Tax=Sistotremastrum niveocremeum HHB9708 TaxID=1314777 RepID=A0A164V1S6_9AGAM|nr:hypothetical protein SISNIDRAFT_67541 [Sistotremastrum niveocremeum HHB9708]